MKVSFKYWVDGYSGEMDGLVYYYNRKLQRYLARRYVKPSYSSSNYRMGQISKNIYALDLSEGYIADLKMYACLYENGLQKSKLVNWTSVYFKLMHAMAKLLNLDLGTITKAEIVAANLPCLCVKTAVEAGLLPSVTGWDRLTRVM